METPEINDYLKRYEKKIRKEVFKRIGNSTKANLFDVEDIVQETMIHLFGLLKDRYDPSISSPHTFIQTHLIYSIYKSIYLYAGWRSYTGKGGNSKRTGSKIVDDKSISMDFGILDVVSSDQKSNQHSSEPFRSEQGYLQFNILHSCGDQSDSEDEILDRIYCEQVIEEVTRRLSEKQLEVFEVLVEEGSNPKFRTGKTNTGQNLSIREISDIVGYKDKKAVSLHIKAIRKIVNDVIEELND